MQYIFAVINETLCTLYLDDLHHDPLSVRFVARLISLDEVFFLMLQFLAVLFFIIVTNPSLLEFHYFGLIKYPNDFLVQVV